MSSYHASYASTTNGATPSVGTAASACPDPGVIAVAATRSTSAFPPRRSIRSPSNTPYRSPTMISGTPPGRSRARQPLPQVPRSALQSGWYAHHGGTTIPPVVAPALDDEEEEARL